MRFDTIQGEVWEGERKIKDQHKLIASLKERGYGTRQALKDLEEMKQAQGHLKQFVFNATVRTGGCNILMLTGNFRRKTGKFRINRQENTRWHHV